MASDVLADISSHLHQSPFVTLMLDETTDVSNTSQAVVMLRYVTDVFDIYEEFIGLYQVPSTNAETLVVIAKDALTDVFDIYEEFIGLYQNAETLVVIAKDALGDVNLPIAKLRGQCFDRAAAMRGLVLLSGSLTKNPEQYNYTHCYGHSINLAMSDSIKACKPVKNSLEVTHEVTNIHHMVRLFFKI